MLSYLVVCAVVVLGGVAAWAISLQLRMRQLATRVVEAESRHRESINQVEHGGLIRRKIEA